MSLKIEVKRAGEDTFNVYSNLPLKEEDWALIRKQDAFASSENLLIHAETKILQGQTMVYRYTVECYPKARGLI